MHDGFASTAASSIALGILVAATTSCSGGPSGGAGGQSEPAKASAHRDGASVSQSAQAGPDAKAANSGGEPLRFSGIPDADKAKLTQMYAVVADYLSTSLGRPVTYVHAPDYTAAVTALAANKVDFVWLGGVTAVQAEQRTKGQVSYVATREADLHFRSYFVANEALVASERFAAAPEPLAPMPLAHLAGLGAAFSESTFTFGSKNSTSGHIMPRYFLSSPEVGIDVDSGFRSRAAYQLQGGHSATLSAVASGAVDVGALNYKTWDNADEATKRKAPVIYVTPEYVDYVVVAHNRIGSDTIDALRSAFVSLDGDSPQHAAVLTAFSARKFVAAQPEQWAGIRDVVASLGELGALH